MTDIVAFLTARLDEAQELAEAAHEIDPAPWSAGVDEEGPGPEYRNVRGNGLVIAADEIGLWDTEGSFLLCMTVPTTRHVAHWDPARVLREIEAKREVVAQYLAAAHRAETLAGTAAGATAVAVRNVLEEVVRVLAEPYSDHPDYEPR